MESRPNKRADIMRAAMELIAEKGFHGAPMALIADKSGVGAGTIYRYFESKDVLIKEIYEDVEGRLLSLLSEDNAIDRPIRERFIYMWKFLLNYFVEHPLDYSYLEQFYDSPYGASCRKAKYDAKKEERDIMVELLEDGVSIGAIKKLPLAILLGLAIGPLVKIMRDHIVGFITLDEELIDHIAEACWDGIKL